KMLRNFFPPPGLPTHPLFHVRGPSERKSAPAGDANFRQTNRSQRNEDPFVLSHDNQIGKEPRAQLHRAWVNDTHVHYNGQEYTTTKCGGSRVRSTPFLVIHDPRYAAAKTRQHRRTKSLRSKGRPAGRPLAGDIVDRVLLARPEDESIGGINAGRVV